MDEYTDLLNGNEDLYNFSNIIFYHPGIIPHIERKENVPCSPNDTYAYYFNTSTICATNKTTAHYELIGFQAFCRGNGSDCANLTLAECGSCSVGQASAFAAVIILLGLAKLVGNFLVIWTALKKRNRNKFDILKISLAFANLFPAFLIFAVTIPNLIWSMNASSVDMLNAVMLSFNTPVSYFASIFFIFGFTASLFHLALMSIQRFYAVRFPVRYKMQGNRPVALSLVLVWILAVTSATIPAWLPSVFEFSYNHILYFYYPTMTHESIGYYSYAPTITLMALFLVLPYVTTVVLMFITAWYIKTIVSRNAAICSDDRRSSSRHMAKRETSVLITVAIMIAGFTLTLAPTVIVVCLYYTRELTRDTYPLAYLATFYLSLETSLVNVVVCSFRDDAFRATAKNFLFCSTTKDDHHLTFHAQLLSRTDSRRSTSKTIVYL